MKILYVSYVFQHPKIRGSARVYYFIKELSRRNQITLLTLSRSEIPKEAFDEMYSYTEKIVTIDVNHMAGQNSSGLGRRLKRAWREQAALKQMRKMLHQLVQEDKYDLVLFHGKSAFFVVEDFKALPVVVDFCDATSMRIRAEAAYANLSKWPVVILHYLQMRQVERKMIRNFPHLAFISLRDRDAILGPNGSAEVIPNGVDLDYWQRRSNNPLPQRLIFTGVMDYKPNEDAAIYLITKILPRLKQSIPNVEIYIAGRDPTPQLRKIAQSHPQVTVTGYVDDMRDYLEQATLFVAPLRFAAGMQNKIQEAFAMGVPVVTTPLVAKGMVTKNGMNPPLYIADGVNEFCKCINSLFSDPIERARLSQEGRDFAEANFVWSRSGERLEELCRQAVLSWPGSGDTGS
jgi:polysaccharide biosynthesis protein PslH